MRRPTSIFHRASGIVLCALCIVLCILLVSCENTTYVSSVPNATAYMDINTNTEWEYVHFKPDNWGEYTWIDHEGYHYHGQTLPLKERDLYRIGYMGLLVVVNMDRTYTTYDLCCPNCITQNRQVAVISSGILAECPVCGEQYDCSCGIGNPQRGISAESLRRYQTWCIDGIIHIRN